MNLYFQAAADDDGAKGFIGKLHESTVLFLERERETLATMNVGRSIVT